MNYDEYINTSNPIHAKAYLKAASHVLSGWPQEWDAETLALALLDEENENQKKVKLWNPIKVIAAREDTDPHLKSDEMILELAESFIDFLEENK